MRLTLVVLVVLLVHSSLLDAQLDYVLPPSPCPSVFSYEGRTAERDRWYGVVLVTTDSPLTGLRLDIRLDRKAQILGNWEGEVTTSDNKRFTILNLDKRIAPGPPISVRVFVKFAPDQELPVIDMIALNGRQICPPLQEGIYHRPTFVDKPWRPSELETNLESAEPLEIDDGYQASLSRPTRPNGLSSEVGTNRPNSDRNPQRPGGGYGSDSEYGRPPSSGYDSDRNSQRPGVSESEYGRPPTTKRPSVSNSGRPVRPSGGYGSESEYESKPGSSGYDRDRDSGRPVRPVGGSEYESKPGSSSHDRDRDSGRPVRPVGGSEYESKPGSSGYDRDRDPGRPVRPVGGSEYESKPGSSGYDRDRDSGRPVRPVGGSEYESKPGSNGYDHDRDPGRPVRPSGVESEFDRPLATNLPGSSYDNSRPSGGYGGDRESSRPRPGGGYDVEGGIGRPSSSYDNDREPPRPPYNTPNDGGPERPTTKRPSVGYDTDRESPRPPARPPSGGYDVDDEFGRPPATKRPSSSYDTERESTRPPGRNPSTTKRPNSGYDSNMATRRPSNGVQVQSSTTRPSNNDRRTTSKRPTTVNAGDRFPDRDVEWISSTTRRPDREQLTTQQSGGLCGRIHVSATPLVTHGQTTSRGQWPWHAALYKAKGINLTYTCGGTLVSSTAVVTAAHCVTTMIGNRPVDPDNLVVYLGKYHLKLWSEGGVQNRQVVKVHVHPQYNSSDFRSDVAVLELSSPVDYTQYVRPVCLWGGRSTDLRDVEGQYGYVVGWGYDEESRVTEELMMARMPIVSQQTCLWSYPEFFSIFTNNMTYCAGFNNGTSVCNGDSGGGMVIPEEQVDGSRVWRLRGLVSISVSKEDKRVCDTKHYVVFTDLAKYKDWISQHID